jgi:hypothetical protein
MSQQKKYFSCLILGIGIATLFFYLSDWYSNQIVIKNKSGQTISTLLVEVSSTRLLLKNIKIDQVVQFEFLIGSDSHYKVTGKLEDGTLIKHDFGYVTHNYFHCRTVIVIRSGGQVEGSSNF